MKYKDKFKVKYFYLKLAELNAPYITSPDNVFDLVKNDFEHNESIIIIGVDNKNKLLIKKKVATGGHRTIEVPPADLFILLLKTNCRSFIMIHNHPSGNASPSEEDILFTKRVKKAAELLGLTILDHIIVGGPGNDYYSFKKNSLL